MDWAQQTTWKGKGRREQRTHFGDDKGHRDSWEWLSRSDYPPAPRRVMKRWNEFWDYLLQAIVPDKHNIYIYIYTGDRGHELWWYTDKHHAYKNTKRERERERPSLLCAIRHILLKAGPWDLLREPAPQASTQLYLATLHPEQKWKTDQIKMTRK